AVSEAGLSHLPLIVLTSDRPHELKNVGAPQAIEQNNMYSNFVRYQTELPIADDHDSAELLINDKVLQASQYFNGINMGPVHFNIPVREPIMPNIERLDLFKRRQKKRVPAMTLPGNIEKLTGTGLVIIGETAEDLTPLKPVLEQGNIITVFDPRQNLRTDVKDGIVNHDMMFSNFGDKHREYINRNVDFIIRIGEPVTSKQTNAFLKQTTVQQYLISEFQDIKPFPVTPGETYVGTVNEILPRMINDNFKSEVKERFITLSKDIHAYIDKHIEKFDDEGRYVYDIIQATDEARTFFLSSSMPIRDFERYDTRVTHEVFANRGANGIDGVISSALGIGTKEQVTMLIGDVSMNHDINSLLMAKLENIDFTVIVFNNNGGNIFSYLPQYAHKPHFERLFGTPLDLNFEHAAKLYDYEYVHIENTDELTKDMLNQSGRQMIEIKTDREHNLTSHNELKQQLKNLVDNAEF
ncbi:MAG: thiamine pyrophosphate-binding protein, partial [Jeotgalicoccus sp.]|nr:thiamine pyrophosphate-binding protein [Jeotgalicoccus sp.]